MIVRSKHSPRLGRPTYPLALACWPFGKTASVLHRRTSSFVTVSLASAPLGRRGRQDPQVQQELLDRRDQLVRPDHKGRPGSRALQVRLDQRDPLDRLAQLEPSGQQGQREQRGRQDRQARTG